MTWWHGSKTPLTTLDFSTKAGLHLGPAAIAATFGPHLHGYTLCSTTRFARAKDTGEGWLQRAKAARKRGIDALVYLNRFEGLPPDAFTGLSTKTLDGLDRLSDKAFKTLFPQAEDCVLVLRPVVLYKAPTP